MSIYQLLIQGSDMVELRTNLLSAAQAIEQPLQKVNLHFEERPPQVVSPTVTVARAEDTVIKAHVTFEDKAPTQTESSVAEQTGTVPAPPAAKPSIVHVRSKLAELTRSGRSAEVVAALATLGCSRLTDVAPEKYADLLASLGL